MRNNQHVYPCSHFSPPLNQLFFFRIWRIFAILLSLTFLTQITTAQTSASIGIQITDLHQHPIQGATVVITPADVQADNAHSSRQFITDNAGHLQVDLPVNHTYKVEIHHIGYQSLSREINVRPGHKNVVFTMRDSGHELTPLEVRAIRAGDHAPFAKTNISAAEIKANNLGPDLPYLLNQVPGVVVNSDAGNGVGYTGIHIRGSDGSRTNVTINGIPYNDAESSGSFFVDMPDIASSLGSIQIQRGIGTSSNGAGAFGATINLSTNEVHPDPYASLSSSAGSFNTWKNTVSAGSGLINGKFTADVRLSHISSDGYIQRASSDLQSLLFSTAYIGKKTTVRFNFLTGKEKTYQAWNGVPEKKLETDRTYNELGMKADGTYYDDQTDNYTQTHYQLFINHQFNQRWSFSLASFLTRGLGYYEEYKLGEDYSDYGISNPDTANTDLIRRKYLDNHFYGQTFSLLYAHKNDHLTLGGSWTNYDGGHYGRVIWAMNGAIPKDHTYYNVPAYKYDKSAYLKWMHDFATYWHLFADVQYRNVWHKMNGFKDNPDLTVKRDFNFFNPKLGLSYARNGYNAYLSYALAGKAPNRDDFEAGQTKQPEREQLHDIELGVDKKAAKYSWSAGLYYMQYKDQLVLTGKLNDVGSATRINVPKSYRAGIELQAGVRPVDWFSATGNIAFSRNKIKDFTAYYASYDDEWNALPQIEESHHNTDIAFSPDIVGAATLNFTPVKNIQISLASKYVGKQYLDNTQKEARSLKGYYNQDVRLSYTIDNKWFKRLQIVAQVYNIFNHYYNTNGATYPEYDNGQLNNYVYYFPAAGTHFMAGINLDL